MRIALQSVSGSPTVTEASDFFTGLFLPDGSVASMGFQVAYQAPVCSPFVRHITQQVEACACATATCSSATIPMSRRAAPERRADGRPDLRRRRDRDVGRRRGARDRRRRHGLRELVAEGARSVPGGHAHSLREAGRSRRVARGRARHDHDRVAAAEPARSRYPGLHRDADRGARPRHRTRRRATAPTP